jgi:hypothetical protein
VACGSEGLTCGPGLGCCVQSLDDAGRVRGPACMPDASTCTYNPTFLDCDGPEDCEAGVSCWASRFRNACGTGGWSRLCHTDADCNVARSRCASNGLCTEPASESTVSQPTLVR